MTNPLPRCLADTRYGRQCRRRPIPHLALWSPYAPIPDIPARSQCYQHLVELRQLGWRLRIDWPKEAMPSEASAI